MSFSIKLKDGDIDLQGSVFGSVSGREKLEQDLTIWLKERFRVDRFQPSYGSVLDDFIGRTITDSTQYEVANEVGRVLQNYQAIQLQTFRDNPSSLSHSEILAEILDITAEVNYDRVEVAITYRTYDGYDSDINLQVDLR